MSRERRARTRTADAPSRGRRQPLDASRPGSAQELLGLQRLAGNAAVARALEPGGRLSSVVASAAHEAPAGPALHVDPVEEREADVVADRAVEHLGARALAPPVRAGALSPALRAAVAAVAPGAELAASLPVRADDAAADALGARAFTDGRVVTVGAGELDDPLEAHRLLAHEAVHAGRHGAALEASGAVAPKLRGTREALEAQGGGRTSGLLRRSIGSLTNWDKILLAVGAYEHLEEEVLRRGNPSREELMALRAPLAEQLGKIEAACLAWQRANPDTAPRRVDEEGRAERDPRTKVGRRQAIAMLLPRVRLEMKDLQSGAWVRTLGLSDTKLVGQGGESSGQKNTVRELRYSTESGEFSGYFKAEKGFAGDIEGHELDVGISQIDPNYGARAVAMYRIDQLLDANVTARAEFAVHDGQLGTVLEKAKGVRATDANFGLTDEHARRLGPGAISVQDPVLQRALSKLQVLDAICGQLDRHQGNWFVNTDESGRVTGVTGIDLDMAFGERMRSPDERFGENYLGMTDQVDEEFGRRILALKPSEIRDAITGLLSESEVEATVARFTSVQEKIRQLDEKGQLVGRWDAKTAFEGRTHESTFRSGHRSYESQISGSAIVSALQAQQQRARAMTSGDLEGLPDRYRAYLRELPEPTSSGILQTLAYLLGGSLYKPLVWSGALLPEDFELVTQQLLDGLLGDSGLMARCEVAVQEFSGGGSTFVPVDAILEPRAKELVAELAAKLRPREKVPA
ncbi:MAG TPA: DUF4157 domain-containing protein [Acidimicrobiales bacterium]|nr:DUF4157 domain-containing protein [Acidimicrobiales bacterium]